ncbi:hypothetical protein ABZT49_03280 [Methylobacterium sp. EM32]|uniref:hypothetical protein n=1 Tax=Methylobacterium sp. EM32 TaxID=3163481 RepID=UPI0033BB2667
MRKSAALLIFTLALIGRAHASSCEVADILFGNVQLDIVRKSNYETAIVRSDNFNNPKKNYGAVLGEITVDRGGFAIRDINQVVVGVISPKLIVEGWDDVCDKRSVISISSAKPGVYVITNGSRPVGTILGRFPKNDFGVK